MSSVLYCKWRRLKMVRCKVWSLVTYAKKQQNMSVKLARTNFVQDANKFTAREGRRLTMKLFLLSSSALSPLKQNIINLQQVCSKHAGYRIIICWGDSEIPICKKCLPEHSGHRMRSISETIKQKQPELKI